MMIQQGGNEREEEGGGGEEQTGPTTPQPGCFFCLLGFLQQPSHSQPASQPVHSSSLPHLLAGAVAEAASAYSPRSQTCYSGIHKTHNTKSTKHKTYTQNTKGRFIINTKHFLLLLHQACTFCFLLHLTHFVCCNKESYLSISHLQKDTISSTICNCFSSERCKSQLLFAFAFLQKYANFIYYLQLLLFLFTHLCASSDIHQLFFSKRCKPSILFAILFFFFLHPFVCIK